MARWYTGDKPCAGCDRPGSEKYRSGGVNDICNDCKALIKLGKGVAKEKPDQFASISFNPYTLNGLEYYIQNKKLEKKYFKTGDPVYISDGHFGGNEVDKGSSKDLLQRLMDLLRTIEVGVKSNVDLRMWMHDSHDSCIFLHKDTALAFFHLVDSIAAYSSSIKDEYYEKGKNLLVGLANGEMTLKDFEEK